VRRENEPPQRASGVRQRCYEAAGRNADARTFNATVVASVMLMPRNSGGEVLPTGAQHAEPQRFAASACLRPRQRGAQCVTVELFRTPQYVARARRSREGA